MMSKIVKGVLSRCQTWHMTMRYVAYRSAKGALSHCERTPFTFSEVMSCKSRTCKSLFSKYLHKIQPNR